MKISIDNSSPIMTQEDTCSVLAESLRKRGHEVKLHMGDHPFYTRINSFPCDYYFTDIGVIDQDMQHYLTNVRSDTLFLVNIPYNVNSNSVLAAEDMFMKNKINFKFIVNSNFSKKGFLVKHKRNLVNFCYGQTGTLLDKEDVQWNRKFDTLFLLQNNSCDINDLLKIAATGETFHTLFSVKTTEEPKYLTMAGPIKSYKHILCNYKSFCFWRLTDAPLGRDFYEIMRLRKPVYVYDPINVNHIHKTLKTEVDLSYSNKGNVNFQPLYDKVEQDFNFEKQVDKLLSHLPKVKK